MLHNSLVEVFGIGVLESRTLVDLDAVIPVTTASTLPSTSVPVSTLGNADALFVSLLLS